MSLQISRIILGIALIFLLWVLFTFQPQHQFTRPRAGNYQYFKDVVFSQSRTHHIGANNHMDARYGPPIDLPIRETRESHVGLLSSFSEFMKGNGLEFWIAHSTLLGWYWNDKVLPWDTDVDVQVSEETLKALASMNMTSHRSQAASRRTYLLDVNAFFNYSLEDRANHIDARWIDTTTGKFVDITAVHRRPQVPGSEAFLFCKDGHLYEPNDIFPLVVGELEGVNISVPQESEKILRREYGRGALSNKHFHWHVFNEKSRLWEAEGK